MGYRNESLINDIGHMAKMAAMPIYGKNLRKSFSLEPKTPMTLKIGMQHWVIEYYNVYSNDDPGMIMTYLTAMSNFVPSAFV